ncbi:MAG TPA: hypothetical protein VHV82_13110 [Sporichthyaceae bacterium]|jgi:hypothetical protein|nr:hypothetical protein [Sporichthyaceae bacterium]
MLAELPLRAAAALSVHLPAAVNVPDPTPKIPKVVKDLAGMLWLLGGLMPASMASTTGMVIR